MASKIRYRSPKYMAHIRGKPCLVCGKPSDPHHLTFTEPRAKGVKNGDQWCVPVCRFHHTELHAFAGGERTWWAINGIKPEVWAQNEFKKWMKDNDDVHKTEGYIGRSF